MVHLDTNFLVFALKAGTAEETKLLNWLARGEDIGMSVVAWAEFLCGPLSAEDELNAKLLLPQPDALLSADAAKAAQLFNQTGRRSRSLPDCLIAAVALRCGAKLATGNTADFTPFQRQGLTLA